MSNDPKTPPAPPAAATPAPPRPTFTRVVHFDGKNYPAGSEVPETFPADQLERGKILRWIADPAPPAAETASS